MSGAWLPVAEKGLTDRVRLHIMGAGEAPGVRDSAPLFPTFLKMDPESGCGYHAPVARRQGTVEAEGRGPACLTERVKLRCTSASWDYTLLDF